MFKCYEPNIENMIESPTNSQINYADAIAGLLEIDFPQSAKDFTKQAYHDFISKYNEEYKNVLWYEEDYELSEAIFFND